MKEVEAGLARYDQQLAAEADLNLVDTASTSTQQQDIGHGIITRVSENYGLKMSCEPMFKFMFYIFH